MRRVQKNFRHSNSAAWAEPLGRGANWTGDIGRSQMTITVVFKQPEVEHGVRLRDFEAWLESNDRSPSKMAPKSRLCQLLDLTLAEDRDRPAPRRVANKHGLNMTIITDSPPQARFQMP
jgi:hypothetical protein